MPRKAFPLVCLGHMGPLLWRMSQHSPKRSGLGQPLQVWFGLVWFPLLFLAAKIFKQKCPVSGTERGGLQRGHRGWAALLSSLLEGRRGAGSPQAQGKVTTLYACWGAQQTPSSPEALNKSRWIQGAMDLGVKMWTLMANFGNLPFENLGLWVFEHVYA